MKASAFAYARATSVDNALELLGRHGDRAKVLSGGQSLMPAMNMRLISLDLIVDIGGLAELRGVELQGTILRIGALTRHVDLLKSPEILIAAPLLREAVAHIAHPAIRNRGTIGGSLAHADPAAELPACMLALEATMVVCGANGERRLPRRISSRGFFRRHWRQTSCWSQSSCRSCRTALSIISMNLPGDAATMRSPALLHKHYLTAASLPNFGWDFLGLAIGRCWQGRPTSWSTRPLRQHSSLAHARGWARSLISRRTSKLPPPCAAIWRGSCSPVVSLRCCNDPSCTSMEAWCDGVCWDLASR